MFSSTEFLEGAICSGCRSAINRLTGKAFAICVGVLLSAYEYGLIRCNQTIMLRIISQTISVPYFRIQKLVACFFQYLSSADNGTNPRSTPLMHATSLNPSFYVEWDRDYYSLQMNSFANNVFGEIEQHGNMCSVLTILCFKPLCEGWKS